MSQLNEQGRDRSQYGASADGKEGVMSELTERGEEDPRVGSPGEIARRVVLRRGAKLVYVVPAVLAAMTAKTAFAFSG